VGFVGYRLVTGPDLPYIYEGYGQLRTPGHIPIESIYFFTICPRSRCSIVLVIAFHVSTSAHIPLRRLDSSWVACRLQDNPMIYPSRGTRSTHLLHYHRQLSLGDSTSSRAPWVTYRPGAPWEEDPAPSWTVRPRARTVQSDTGKASSLQQGRGPSAPSQRTSSGGTSLVIDVQFGANNNEQKPYLNRLIPHGHPVLRHTWHEGHITQVVLPWGCSCSAKSRPWTSWRMF
jgi:hypothetical protein